ncbi:hypothetical protein ACM46_16760 [Chryseobacterium angstadtii]|uniref:MAM domain-containing protein n=1 Tax=Chryseobacterium angstadtii TaxID=558151 RepID=A0A0J7I6U3_9FLAO|nr:hypothetical protein ACM46_16760 [Chryseobacterium angstadtii]
MLSAQTTSANAITNGNFGTDTTTGGNLNGWATNGTGTDLPTSNNWFAVNGGATAFRDGAEGLNLTQSNVVFKTSSSPKYATFSVKISPVNAFGVPVNTSWGKMSIWLEGPSGGFIKLFSVFNPITADANSPTVNITEINPAIVQKLAVNNSLTARSFATGAYSTVDVTVDTDLLPNSGIVLFQRNNGTASGPNGTAGTDDFFIDDVSYTHLVWPDTDNDGIDDSVDIDDDNDGVPDATENPICYFSADEWNTGVKPQSIVTISSALTTTTGFFDQLTDGVNNVSAVTFSNTPAQAIQNANVYLFNFAYPVRLDALYLKFNTATQFAGTTKIQGSNTNNGTDWVDLSAAISQAAVSNTTVNGDVSVTTSIKYPVTLNTTTAFKYIRITGVAATNIAAQNASEVYFDFNTPTYVASRYPKLTCTGAGTDADGDGTPNHLDLDSDNDGCSDAKESGATTNTTANYQFPDIDSNNDGLVDAVDANNDGIVDYSSVYSYAINSSINACTDSDGDGIADVNDIDDDNDGILDTVEAGCNPNVGYNTTSASGISNIFSQYGVNSGTLYTQLADDIGLVFSETSTFASGILLSSAACAQPALQGTTYSSDIWIKSVNPTNITQPVPLKSISFKNDCAASSTNHEYIAYSAYDVSGNLLYTYNIAADPTIVQNSNFRFDLVMNPNYQVYSIKISRLSNAVVVTGVTLGTGNGFSVCNMSTDTDGDGVPNYLDLDSDGDGCPDLKEAGVSPLTDLFTPSATNNVGGSYGIANPAGSQLNPSAADTNNDGLNDSVDPDLNGVTNYTSTYNAYAINSSINACTDSDGDGITNVNDIDDDNDGVPDKVECPGIFGNMTTGGGFSTTAANIPNWYMGLASATLPIAEPFTPTVISISNTGAVYNYGIGGGNQVNSPLTGGLFDTNDGGNTAAGLQYVLQENDPNRPVVNKLSSPLVAGATYNYAFDLGLRTTTGTTNKYIVMLYNADTQRPEKMIESGVLNTLPGTSDTPSYKNFTGSFVPALSGNYYLLFYPSVSGGAADDFVIDRVAVAGVSSSTCDTDGDGVPNYLDLDSDGDGCPDAMESGVYEYVSTNGGTMSNGSLTTNMIDPTGVRNAVAGTGAPADYGANGFYNLLETTENGIAKYPSTYDMALDPGVSNCSDRDGDGIPDFVDIDDDNDGVLDRIEACPSRQYSVPGDVIDGSTTTVQSSVPSAGFAESPATTCAGTGTIDNQYPFSNPAACSFITRTGTQASGTWKITFSSPVPADRIMIGFVTAATAATTNLVYTYAVNPGTDATLGTARDSEFSDIITRTNLTKNGSTSYSQTTLGANTDPAITLKGFGNRTVKSLDFSVSGVAATGAVSFFVTIQSNNCDPDGDGIVNSLDNDSDNDNCSDAVEAGVITYVTANGGTFSPGTLNNPSSTLSPNATVGNNTPADYGANGFYTVIENNDTAAATYNGTYTYANAINAAITACALACFRPAVTAGTILPTLYGITALGRAAENTGSWPGVRKGGWVALEAKTKGFVPNRLTTAQINAIPAADLAEGMMVYNITLDCLYINTDGTAAGWKCFNTQTCP